MTITYVISGTRPNLSIQATDGYETVVTVNYNTNDAIQNAYNSIRQAFINAYSDIVITSITTGTGDTRTCECSDTRGNTMTMQFIPTDAAIKLRNDMIGKFVDMYGMDDDNLLYQKIMSY